MRLARGNTMLICRKCDKRIEGEGKICRACGGILEEVPDSQSPDQGEHVGAAPMPFPQRQWNQNRTPHNCQPTVASTIRNRNQNRTIPRLKPRYPMNRTRMWPRKSDAPVADQRS